MSFLINKLGFNWPNFNFYQHRILPKILCISQHFSVAWDWDDIELSARGDAIRDEKQLNSTDPERSDKEWRQILQTWEEGDSALHCSAVQDDNGQCCSDLQFSITSRAGRLYSRFLAQKTLLNKSLCASVRLSYRVEQAPTGHGSSSSFKWMTSKHVLSLVLSVCSLFSSLWALLWAHSSELSLVMDLQAS